jgi:hypothetical protein
VDGEWQRRRVAGGSWEKLTSVRAALQPEPVNKRVHMKQPPTTKWSWK